MAVEGRPPKIAIADPSNLFFSDDYRAGWRKGFEKIGCDVQVFDVSRLATITTNRQSPYATASASRMGMPFGVAIAKWQPDLVFCHHGRYQQHEPFLAEFRKRGIPTAVYLCDEPYESGETVKYSPRYDFIFTMDPGTLAFHRAAKAHLKDRVFYLPPGVDTDFFRWQPYDKSRNGPFALFLGNASLTPRPEWLKPVERVIEGVEIKFWKTITKKNPDTWIDYSHHAKLYSSCLLGLNVHRAPEIDLEQWKIRMKMKRLPLAQVPGFRPLAEPPARPGTGFHNEFGLPARHINPRFFEMSSCGTPVISDDSRTELARLFPMAPRAQDPDHFLELVSYYLEHPLEAGNVGKICSFLILKRHTYCHRAAEILHRVGLKPDIGDPLFSSLGEPGEWLTTQDFDMQGICQSSGRTGSSERFDPLTGSALMDQFGLKSSRGLLEKAPPFM